VVAVGVDMGMLGAWRRKELSGSGCRKWNLNATQTDVPVDVVLENESCLEAGIQKP
jgi:hypothetical protein